MAGVAAAGLTGGRVNRFNIVKQSKDYDADGAYVRHWVPELKDVPTSKVHEPWALSNAEQKECGLILGVDYPRPPISQFKYGDGGGKGGGKGGKGGGKGGRGGGSVPQTPGQAAVMKRAEGGGGKGRGGRGGGGARGGGGRKRVQHGFYGDDD